MRRENCASKRHSIRNPYCSDIRINMPGISSAAILLLVLGAVVPTAYGEPAVIPKDAKIVEGTDRVSGTGIDQTLAYMTPDSFYGPEALYLLFGTCFTELVER